jgi:hypothetical protein
MKDVAAEKLKTYLGLARVDHIENTDTLAMTDDTLL